MGRTPGFFVGAGLMALTLATTGGAQAAGEVVVSASPSDVRVGEPVDVMVRTFLPIERDGTLAVANPREPYPGPSGLWNVLYPWDDYPFDVVARHLDGTEIQVTIARDPYDSTLWRGFVSLPKAGAWMVWVRNFPGKEPGSTTVVRVGDPQPGSIGWGPAALAGVLLGLLGGFAVARRRQLA